MLQFLEAAGERTVLEVPEEFWHDAPHVLCLAPHPRRLATLTELVGSPPPGVAPLDQFREALLLTHEAAAAESEARRAGA